MTTQTEALKLALEALEVATTPLAKDRQEVIRAITVIKEALAQEKALQALHNENERLGLYKDAYAQPEEEKLHPVHIGVDVTREGTAVTAFYRKPDAVMEMFYSQFHPMAQQEQEPVATVTSEAGNPDVRMSWWHEPALPVGTKLYTTPPQLEERNFCPRCGKRNKDIHTCTPPQENT